MSERFGRCEGRSFFPPPIGGKKETEVVEEVWDFTRGVTVLRDERPTMAEVDQIATHHGLEIVE